MSKVSIAAVLTMAAFATGAAAQDTRTVTEPVLPPVCVVLDAALTAVADGPYRSLAPADEAKTDTDRIQQAIDGCGKGKAVALRAKGAADAFLSGPLQLRQGVTLVVDKGATLFASLDLDLFAVAPGSCGALSAIKGSGCRPLIRAERTGDAGVMGDGVIDGRAGVNLLGKTETAWDIAQATGQGGKILPRLIVADHADNFTLYRITLKNSANFHVVYNAGDGFTVWGVKIDTPRRLPRAPRPLSHNTDGIDPGNGSKNITITHSFIRDGDDNIAIKGGAGGLTNMTVSHNHFYWGHGMSIGSETYGGVSKVRVFDLTLDGTDSGLRIKSSGDRGGLVENVVYEDVCIRTSPHPILITGSYASTPGSKHARFPTYTGIVYRKIGILGGGELTFSGYSDGHRAQATLDGVFLLDADQGAKYAVTLEHADLTYGKGDSNVALPAGTDATVTGTPGPGEAPSCSGRFVPFPE